MGVGVGVSRTIYVNVDTPNLGFTYLVHALVLTLSFGVMVVQ